MRSDDYAPEWRLLLSLAHSRLDERADRTDLSLPDSFDWMRFYRLAEKNDVLPLVHRHLKVFLWDRISEEAAEAFYNYQMKFAIHQRIHLEELNRVRSLLAEEGIASVAFKGPALGIIAYGDPSLRDYDDLDLLVRESQVKAATLLLRDNGYLPNLPPGALEEDRSFLRWLKSRKETHFMRKDERVNLDLHWKASNFLTDAMNDRLWDRVTEIRSLDQPLLTFDLETSLMLTCIHGDFHGWRSLKWICDVAEAMGRLSEAGFRRLDEESRACGAARRVVIGFGLAAHFLNASIPAEWREAVSFDRKNRWRIHQFAKCLLSDADIVYSRKLLSALSADNARDLLFRLRLLSRWSEKDDDWAALPLSLTARYLFRPIKMLVRLIKENARR